MSNSNITFETHQNCGVNRDHHGNLHDWYQKSTCMKYTFQRKRIFQFFWLKTPPYRLKAHCYYYDQIYTKDAYRYNETFLGCGILIFSNISPEYQKPKKNTEKSRKTEKNDKNQK